MVKRYSIVYILNELGLIFSSKQLCFVLIADHMVKLKDLIIF